MYNLLVIALSFLFAGRVFAASPLVAQMEAPRTPTNQTDIAINVVVLDQNQVPSISVQCYWRKDGGAWSGLGAAHTVIPGGNNTANCQTSANEINNDGSTYEFYATADDGATSATTQTVSVVYTRSGPGTPTNFSKDKTSCTYKISFHTANDSGKTAKVEIYRSANNSFPLDGSTKVGEVSVGSNTDATYNDTPPDCGTAYYYGIRAFDAAGNGSGAVGESQPTVITTTTTTKTGTSGASGAQGAIPAGNNGNVLGAVNNASEGPTGASGAVLGEATPSAIPTPTPASKATRTTPWLIGGGVLVVLFLVWQANRKKSA